MKHPLVFISLLSTGLLFSCMAQAPEIDPLHDLSRRSFSPDSAIESRIVPTPDDLLASLREWDQRPDYRDFAPDSATRDIIARVLNSLPAASRDVLQRRLTGIHFVEGFMGAGMADWVLGADRQVHACIVISSNVLGHSAAEWLALRDASAFVPQAGVSVKLEGGDAVPALEWALVHELGHVLDYCESITPYTEETLAKLTGGPTLPGAEKSAFTQSIWQDYSRTADALDWPGRSRTSFYLLGPQPDRPLSAIVQDYEALSRSPFTSLYGARNWADDFAETFAWRWLQRHYAWSWQFTVYRDGAAIARFSPEPAQTGAERLALVDRYVEGQP